MATLPAPGSLIMRQLIGDEVARLPVDATLRDVAEALDRLAIGAVVLGDDPRPAALVSERDVVRAVAGGHDPGEIDARSVASTDLVWCDVESTVDEVAAEMLVRYIRHVLVEEDGRLVGIVSARDLLGVYCSESMPE